MGKIIITGCGRCGTHYLFRFLTQMGIHVNHEFIGKDGGVGWTLAFYKAQPEDRVLHVIRNPVDQISSMLVHGHIIHRVMIAACGGDCEQPFRYGVVPGYFEKVGSHGTLPKHGPPVRILKAAWNWLHFNQYCEVRASSTFDIGDFIPDSETVEKVVLTCEEALGIVLDRDKVRRVVASLPRDVNTSQINPIPTLGQWPEGYTNKSNELRAEGLEHIKGICEPLYLEIVNYWDHIKGKDKV